MTQINVGLDPEDRASLLAGFGELIEATVGKIETARNPQALSTAQVAARYFPNAKPGTVQVG